MKINVETLEKLNFNEYGDVITWKGNLLSSTSPVHDYWDGVASYQPVGTQVCSLLGIKKPISQCVCEMERHLKTPEVLVSLQGDVVITLAPAGGDAPDEKAIRSFLLKQGQGVIMHQGVWHALPCKVKDDAMLLVMFQQNTSHSDDPNVKTDIFFSSLSQDVEFLYNF
jgi:ureidoglycolate hydrolase